MSRKSSARATAWSRPLDVGVPEVFGARDGEQGEPNTSLTSHLSPLTSLQSPLDVGVPEVLGARDGEQGEPNTSLTSNL